MADLKDLRFPPSESSEQISEDKDFIERLVKPNKQKIDDLIKSMPPHIPNPIEKTNEQLEILVNESLTNSVSGKRWNWTALLFSVVSIGIAIIAFNSSNDSSRKLEELIRKQNNLIEQSNKPVAVTVPSIKNEKSNSKMAVVPPEVVQEKTEGKAKVAIIKEIKI